MVNDEDASGIYTKAPPLKSLPSVRELRAFVAIYHTGSLSVAAESLALTQPAVTVLLRELEEKLGVRLFDRTTRSVRRTDACKEAIAFAERALAELEAMSSSMLELAHVRRGRICIAATSSVAQTLLPKVVRQYLDEHPEVEVSIDDCAPGDFAERILSERVDFGIGTLESPMPGLAERPLIKDYLCAVATNEAFAAERPISWKQLAKFRTILVKPGYGVRRSIDNAVAEAQTKLQVAFEVSLLTTAMGMAANGLGVTVMPGTLVNCKDFPDLRARRLVRPTVERITSMVSKEGKSLLPAADAFADVLMREYGSARR